MLIKKKTFKISVVDDQCAVKNKNSQLIYAIGNVMIVSNINFTHRSYRRHLK